MAKILKPDKVLAEKEAVKRDYKDSKQDAENSYLQQLQKDQSFQEIVVRGILEKEVERLKDVTNIPAGDCHSMGHAALAARMTVQTLEKILTKLR